MEISEIQNNALFENRFWLQVMGDHSRFIYYTLSPNETAHIQKARQFMGAFDQLLDMSRKRLTEAETDSLNRTAHQRTTELQAFKLQLLALTLEARVKINLSSTFFNHMLNELEDYLLVLNALMNRESTVFHPLHYHLLWLLDALGHAASVSDNLDLVEKDYIHKGREFQKMFNDLYLKAIELNGFTRTNMNYFNALTRLNEQAAAITVSFKDFLEQVKAERMNARLLGTLMPLMADHMAREECYYITKLSLSAQGIRRPDCDPTRQRVES